MKTYVGEDGKLHFVDSEGADTVLNFSSYKINTVSGGTSVSLTSVPNYKNLQLWKNIFPVATGLNGYYTSSSQSQVTSVSYSYTDSTGTLTITATNGSGNSRAYITSVKVYIVQ